MRSLSPQSWTAVRTSRSSGGSSFRLQSRSSSIRRWWASPARGWTSSLRRSSSARTTQDTGLFRSACTRFCSVRIRMRTCSHSSPRAAWSWRSPSSRCSCSCRSTTSRALPPARSRADPSEQDADSRCAVQSNNKTDPSPYGRRIRFFSIKNAVKPGNGVETGIGVSFAPNLRADAEIPC